MDLEARILSGGGFPNSPTLSPTRSPARSRSPSPDPLFPANGDLSDSDISDSQFGMPSRPSNSATQVDSPQNGTGVKSVIRDRNEAARRDREKHIEHVRSINHRLEKMALITTTYAQDEELRLLEKATEEGLSQDQGISKRMLSQRPGRFGHLREIGPSGFIDAIDGAPKDTWVVLHIYDPTSSRCHELDSTLARLARQYPNTKFIRTRAGAIGFATFMPTPKPRRSNFLRNFVGQACDEEDYELDDDVIYNDADEEEEFEDGNQASQSEQIDSDLFPTMLVYRGGELVYTWIRVDWEADGWIKRKEGGSMDNPMEALLKGHNIIQHSKHDNCGFSSDDEDLDRREGHDDNDNDNDNDDDEIFDL